MLSVRARLVQKRPGVIVYVDPQVRLSVAVRQISCFVERFTVFQERAARPCEGVDWILSYYSILTLRCAYLHYSPQRLGFSLNTPTLSRKQPKGSGEVTHSKSQEIFSHFFRSRCSLVSEERQTELRSRNSSLGWGTVHCDTNVITRGPPATGVAELAKRGKSVSLIIVGPAIPSFWGCQILPSTTLGSHWNPFNISLRRLGSLPQQGDMVRESGQTSQSTSFFNCLCP